MVSESDSSGGDGGSDGSTWWWRSERWEMPHHREESARDIRVVEAPLSKSNCSIMRRTFWGGERREGWRKVRSDNSGDSFIYLFIYFFFGSER